MTKNPPITYARLRQVISYNPITGIFTWLEATARKTTVGATAGTVNKRHRYIYITIDGSRHGAHQWAHFYMTEQWPQNTVDHRDRDRINNRWDNLREATHQQQNRNVGIQINNSSGFIGVYWHKAASKWAAHITVDYRTIHLGLFDRAEDAHEAYKAEAKKQFGDFFHQNAVPSENEHASQPPP